MKRPPQHTIEHKPAQQSLEMTAEKLTIELTKANESLQFYRELVNQMPIGVLVWEL